MFDNKQTRRSFMASMMGFLVAGPSIAKKYIADDPSSKVFVSTRKRLPNPYLENGKPIVVIVKGTDFAKMLAKGMDLLGGFSRFGTNRSVIIKPNFVFDKKTRYPTTTDENSVLTTIQYLQHEGFNDITVADRRGNRVKGRAGGKFEWSGLNDKALAGGFKTDSLMDNEVAETVYVRNKQWTKMTSVGVIKKIYDADLIINMPTLKRHSITNLTCSLKNMMGVLDVPTTQNMHLWGDENRKMRDSMSRDESLQRLCLTISEAFMAVNPEMTIIDARKILCKDHLSVRTGEPREANRLIISGDSLAADICATRLMKEINTSYDFGITRYTFEHASYLGLGNPNTDNIVLKEVEV